MAWQRELGALLQIGANASDPDTSALEGATTRATKKGPPPLTFDFGREGTSTLTIKLPAPQGGKTEEASSDKARPNLSAPSAQEKAMMKRMFDDFRFRTLIKVDGEIAQTNASYAHKGEDGKTQYVTLFDMDIGELLNDEKEFEKLVSLGRMEDMATGKTKPRGIPDLKIETEREVTISFDEAADISG